MTNVHPTAIIHPGAELADGVEIGPYSVVGPNVRIGSGTRLMAHVFVDGWTAIGSDCVIFPFASIGTRTQDLKYKGGQPRVEIGDRNTVREYVTVNAATSDGDVTKIGSDCLLMAYVHVAHDCILGNGVIMANAATLAGHVIVEDMVGIGGLCGVHQFVRLGKLCYTGGFSKITQDIPPFMIADGAPVSIHTINSVGLKRRGISDESQGLLKKAYKILYRENLSVSQAVEKIEKELQLVPEIKYLIDFIKNSTRGITK